MIIYPQRIINKFLDPFNRDVPNYDTDICRSEENVGMDLSNEVKVISLVWIRFEDDMIVLILWIYNFIVIQIFDDLV